MLGNTQDFYLIRHGETDWNMKTRRFQGHTDIPLNDIGIRQATELKTLIKDLQIDLFISSDLSRAHRTASILAGTEDIPKDIRLREVHLGSAEGLTPDEVDLAHGADFRKNWSGFEDAFMDLCYPGGESRKQVIHRFQESLHYYLDQHQGKKIAFVSHGFAIRSFVYACGLQVKDFFVPNCALLPFQRNLKERTFVYKGLHDPQALLKPSIKTILEA